MNTPKLKPMQVIHSVFCLAIAGFAIVAVAMLKDRLHFSLLTDKNDPYFPLFPILAPLFVIAGFFLFNRQIAAIDPAATGDDKIAGYQTAFLIRCACMEAAGLLNTVALLRSGNGLYLLVVAIVLVVFAMTRPSKDHIIETTNLQFPDTEKL
jgi:UDP-N-acetylmuramyl pentapeptide phosphotransferase/UDP-N-acetylglucosamine-1-phosphate transferase